MSNPISGNSQSVSPNALYKKNLLSGFQRLQLSLAAWGGLLLLGGWLHNTNSQPWGPGLTLLMWVIIGGVGFALNYWLAPAFLSSGVMFMWGIVIVLGLVISWVVRFPLADQQIWPALSVSWHLVFAVGYFMNGYFSDKRLWWLAGWEVLAAIFMAFVATNPPPPAGNTPLMLGQFMFYSNQGLMLGLTSGIPLLIAALPIWKEKYSRG